MLLGVIDRGARTCFSGQIASLPNALLFWADIASEDVTLTCCILDFIGIAARATGPEFVSHPRLLLASFFPLLDRLGSHRQEVQSLGTR